MNGKREFLFIFFKLEIKRKNLDGQRSQSGIEPGSLPCPAAKGEEGV